MLGQLKGVDLKVTYYNTETVSVVCHFECNLEYISIMNPQTNVYK